MSSQRRFPVPVHSVRSAPSDALESSRYPTLNSPGYIMTSSQSHDEHDAVIADTSEFNALGERPVVYLTRPTIGIGSDKPLFTSRRRAIGLNPSSIPVRSDTADRSNSHNDEVGAGQRRFLRTGAARTLKGAFQAAAEIMDGSQERNLDEEEDKEEQQQREYEAQAKHASPRFRRPKPLARGGGTRVPGYTDEIEWLSRNSLAGSTAATTKTPGLREAYQRVVDAETASAVEGEVAGDNPAGEWNAHHYTFPGSSVDMDQIRVEYLRNAASPDITNTLLRLLGEPKESGAVGTVGFDNAMGDERRVHHLLNSTAVMKSSPQSVGGFKAGDTDTDRFDDKENNTMESGHTAISGISSIIADETDDSFGRLLSAYAKDKQRVQGALSSDTKAFSKTKVGERSGLSAESLERRDAFDKVDDSDVTSTKISDPPVQIPRDWGRKGRHSTDWLERIVGTGGKEGLREDPTGDPERDTVDWHAAAEDIPLPSIEDESTVLPRSHHQTGADPQTEPRKTSTDRTREREGPTPPAQGSTPHQNRSTLLDTIREREIESLRDRAVTTSRLGEIKERTSRESLRSRTPSDDKLDHKRRDRRGSSRSEGSSSQGEAGREAERGPTKDNKDPAPDASHYADEGEHIPFTPITIFKNSQQYSKPNHNRQSAEGNDKKSDIDGRDSRDVLRRLARAASSSPKSADDKQKASDYKTEDGKPEKQSQSVVQQDLEDSSSTPRLPKSLNFEEQTKEDEGRPRPTPSFHVNGPGAWFDTPAPMPTTSDPGSPPSDYDVDNEISALGLRDFIRGPSSSPLYTRSGGLKGRPSKPDTIPRRRKSEPVVPTTRRQIEAANTKLAKTVQGNDTDLSSLFDFYPDDADNTYAAVPMGDTTSIPERPRPLASAPLTSAERERQREMLVYESLNRRLRALQTEIAEAKRGIEGLEGKITEDLNTAWDKKPTTVQANANDYTITIKVPGKGFVRSFARSLVYDRKWRWLRWWFYGWCFFWVYAIIEFYF
ncbi:MAG: hypothetical protein M1839_006209 [Geoglossum umbratile]|nr:MAG: hypothetical protein M1839_006209 [Geoglossum umbratile]